MNLATVAAFTAAGVALIVGVFSVVWGSRLSTRAQLDQWRRNEERPIVARVLTLSEDARQQWDQAWSAKQGLIAAVQAEPDPDVRRTPEFAEAQDRAVEQWRVGAELYGKLRFETAQLDLIAGRPVRDVADRLARAHESSWHWLRPAGGANITWESFAKQNNKIVELHEELVGKTRADLGLTTGNRQTDGAERRWVDLMTPIARV